MIAVITSGPERIKLDIHSKAVYLSRKDAEQLMGFIAQALKPLPDIKMVECLRRGYCNAIRKERLHAVT